MKCENSQELKKLTIDHLGKSDYSSLGLFPIFRFFLVMPPRNKPVNLQATSLAWLCESAQWAGFNILQRGGLTGCRQACGDSLFRFEAHSSSMIIYHVTIAVETFARVISETLKIKCWKLISDGEIFCWAIKTLETLVNGWILCVTEVLRSQG